MSREIKFRAWDAKEMLVMSPEEPGRPGFLMDFFVNVFEAQEPGEDNIKLMQFTGLRDKNGQDIYEGDITKDSTGVCLIGWNDQLASFCLRRNGWAFDHFFAEAVDPSDVEVIGNIYENPELLKC